MHISMDGYVAGPKNSLADWISTEWTQDLKDYVTAVSDTVDTILLGSGLAKGLIPAWRGPMVNEPGADFINGTDKVVFSSTLNDNPYGGNVSINSGDLVEEVKKTKAEEGRKNIIVYGGVQFVQSLLVAGLVDELRLLVDPVALGDGARLFTTREDHWEVVEARLMDCGSVSMRYTRKA